MMKKQFAVLILSSLLLVTPAIASKDDNHGQGNNAQENQQNEVHSQGNSSDHDKNDNDGDETAHSTVSPTPMASCDPSAEWKNHGQFVSCVAHQHEDGDENGDEDVDDAAHSEVGKHHDHNSLSSPNPSVTPSPTVTPSPSPTASATATPTPTPSVSPSPTASSSATPSATPIVLGGEDLNANDNSNKDIFGLEQLLNSIKHLFENFLHH